MITQCGWRRHIFWWKLPLVKSAGRSKASFLITLINVSVRRSAYSCLGLMLVATGTGSRRVPLGLPNEWTPKGDFQGMSLGYQLFPLLVTFGPLGEKKVGAVFNKKTIQLCNLTRYGFQLEDPATPCCDWDLITKINNFDFITRRIGVDMRCSINKSRAIAGLCSHLTNNCTKNICVKAKKLGRRIKILDIGIFSTLCNQN
jgi:hypothetical protein